MAAPKFRFGKNAVLEVAPATAQGAEPPLADASWKVLCLTKEVKIARENGTETIENFCTNGQEIEVADGSSKGTMDLGETLWVEDDPVLQMIETACFSSDENGTTLYMHVYPIGKGAGKPYYKLTVQVKKWELTMPSKGTIKVDHDINVIEGPTKAQIAS